MYIYIYIYIYTHAYITAWPCPRARPFQQERGPRQAPRDVCTYIYIYIERERER